MDVAVGELFNTLRVKPGEDLEDIYDGILCPSWICIIAQLEICSS